MRARGQARVCTHMLIPITAVVCQCRQSCTKWSNRSTGCTSKSLAESGFNLCRAAALFLGFTPSKHDVSSNQCGRVCIIDTVRGLKGPG